MSLNSLSTTKLKNGWTVLEFQDPRMNVFVEEDALGPGKGRFTFDLVRVPSTRVVRVIHFNGTTPKERAHAMRTGIRVASGKGPKRLPWSRRRTKNGKNWCFYVVMGVPILEAEEFERLTRGAHTDDSIEIEFQSIVQQIGVNA